MRFAVVVEGDSIQAWEAACVDALVEAGCPIAGRASVGRRTSAARYGAPASEKSVPLSPPVSGAAQIREGARWPGGIDVAIAFDEPRAVRALSLGAREAWAFSFGPPGDAALPAGVGALARCDGAFEASLVRITRDGRSAIKSGAFPVIAHSLAQTVDGARFGAAAWPSRVAREEARGCEPESRPVPQPDASARPTPAPSAAVFALALAARAAERRFGYLFRHEHWNIGIAERPIESFLTDGTLHDVRWLPAPPRGSFVADPFGYAGAGTAYLLCEGFSYADETGFLASGAIAEGPRATLAPFLRLPVHLSYPFVIADAGEVYCIPEMGRSGRVDLYRAVHLPDRWERVATLLDGFGGIDPTVVRHDGRWWMFCTNPDAPNHELHAFHAQRLAGPWIAHARNPVKVDVRSARPAGTPFYAAGALHRPAQDCGGGYGRRVVINRVDALTPTEFDERPVAFVEPDPAGPYRCGVHTLSSAGSHTLVDGKTYRFAPAAFAATARQYVRRLAGRRRAGD